MAELRIEEAQAHLKQTEKDLDINLNFFRETLSKMKTSTLTRNIVNGYKGDFGQNIKIQLKESIIKGTLLFLDSQSGELTLTVNGQSKTIKVHKIHYKENYKRIYDNDPEQEALLKPFIFYKITTLNWLQRY